MQLWHLSFASTNRLPLFSTEASRRMAVRALARTAPCELVIFSVVDEHLHLVSIGDAARTRRLRQALHRRLQRIAAVPLAPSWSGPVRNRKQLLTLVHYHLSQVARHAVQGAHPALWSGSCFQDLVGARHLSGLKLQLSAVLPREQIVPRACDAVGLPRWALTPVAVGTLGTLGMGQIREAAAAAAAVAPGLQSGSREAALARRVAAHLGVAARISRREVRRTLGLSRQGLAAALARDAPGALVLATRLRLALQREVARRYRAAAEG